MKVPGLIVGLAVGILYNAGYPNVAMVLTAGALGFMLGNCAGYREGLEDARVFHDD